MLRLRRSIWLGLPTGSKLGSEAGRWWSALALLLAIHGAIRWTTDMVDHQGEVALRGGALGHRKDTCTAASALAE
eukprot:6880313-Pyramimonas_sp.AAC.1